MEYIYNFVIILISYFLGCVPSAVIIVKFFSGKDIRNEGTGNIGAMNSFEVTGKKTAGIAVFLVDALKGATAILLANFISNGNFTMIGIAAVWVVVGHNFNIFLKFKGGKGLATAFGAMLFINPLTIILWGLMWITGYNVIKKDINVGNISATILAPLLLFSSPTELIKLLNIIPIDSIISLKILFIVICVVVLLKHRDNFKDLVTKKLD